jgi:hypothetical protein
MLASKVIRDDTYSNKHHRSGCVPTTQDQSDIERDVYLEGLNVNPVTLSEYEEMVRWA